MTAESWPWASRPRGSACSGCDAALPGTARIAGGLVFPDCGDMTGGVLLAASRLGTPSLGRVPIIEDDARVAATIRDAVTDLGYESAHAPNGPDALRRVALARPDVILLDITMPGMSGVEVLDALRRDHPEIPVVMVSGNLDEEVARGTLARGAFDDVVKPFDFDGLGRILAAAVAYGAT